MFTEDPSPLLNQPATEPEVSHEQNQLESIPQPTHNPQADAWFGFLKAVIAWVGSVVSLLIVPLIVIVPYFAYLMTTSGPPTAEGLTQNKTFILLSIIGIIPAHLLTLLLAWALVSRWGKEPFWKRLNFSWPPSIAPWAGFAVCFVIAIVLLGIGLLVTSVLGGGKTDLDKLIESSFQARIATAFVAVVTAPLVEEIIYRGMLYPAIQRITGMTWAVVIVSLMFAGVHVLQYRNNIGVILVITILSVTLTSIRAYTDRLLPTFIVHLIFNGLQSLYLVLQPFIEKPEKVEPAPALAQLCHLLRHLF